MSSGPRCRSVSVSNDATMSSRAAAFDTFASPAAIGQGNGRLRGAHSPVVAGELHALRDRVAERRGRLGIGTQPVDDRMARGDRPARRGRYLADAVARLDRVRPAVPRRLLHVARRQLGQELDALQLAHQRVAQAGRELAQHDVADGICVPAGNAAAASVMALALRRAAFRFPRGSAAASPARSASPGDGRTRLRASGACRRIWPHPVSATMIGSLPHGLPRMRRHASNPFMCSMPMSRKTTSGRNSASAETAANPSCVTRTSLPISSSSSPMLVARSTLSSATRMRRRRASGAAAAASVAGSSPRRRRRSLGMHRQANDELAALGGTLAVHFDRSRRASPPAA